MNKKNIILFFVLGLLFLPWLGECLFNTKGEPREAIVAVSMLDSGNWILPESYGQDIPYKPPMLAWLISLFSLVFNGGHVSEFTSRLPSALSAIFLLLGTYRLLRSRVGQEHAAFVTIITATSFEFFRASVACRVDMVLTAAMVCGIFAIYNLREKPLNWLWAILLLSVATLTKGPIGSLLPCLAMGIYFLLRGDNFWRTLFSLTTICLASFILPALWYYAAWLQGGDDFISLAMEENIGRLTGTMSYESHTNPWWYNVHTILSGMLPWTLIVVIGLCYRRIRAKIRSIKVDRGLPLMAWTVGLTIFIFYCIPASKRSVYLLPCYPFMAYGVAWVITHLRGTRLMRVSSMILAVLAIVAPLLLISASLIASDILPLEAMPWWRWPLAMIPVITGLWWLFKGKYSRNMISGVILTVYAIYLAYNSAFAPMVLNPKSDIHSAEIIASKVGDSSIYGIIPKDPLMRYYTINYYLDDRMRRIDTISEVNSGTWVIAPQAPDGVVCDTLTKRSCDTRRPIVLFRVP